jgi:putative transposase
MSKESPKFDSKLIDELIKNCKTQEDVFGKGSLLKDLQKAILERMLAGELTTELGYEKNSSLGKNSGNSRNGYSEKTLKGAGGEFTINIPQIIPKNQTRFEGFDEKIIALYARGMTTRDIQEQLKELYGGKCFSNPLPLSG